MENSDTQTDQNGATSMVEMESLIARYLGDIEVMRGKIKEEMSMFKDAFQNDKEYVEQEAKVKEANRAKNAIKQRILKQPALAEADEKIKHMKSEMKNMQEALSDYLREYQRNSNMTQIVLPNGDTMQIIHVTRLKKVTKDDL